jgi:hypothetical protein
MFWLWHRVRGGETTVIFDLGEVEVRYFVDDCLLVLLRNGVLGECSLVVGMGCVRICHDLVSRDVCLKLYSATMTGYGLFACEF